VDGKLEEVENIRLKLYGLMFFDSSPLPWSPLDLFLGGEKTITGR